MKSQDTQRITRITATTEVNGENQTVETIAATMDIKSHKQVEEETTATISLEIQITTAATTITNL